MKPVVRCAMFPNPHTNSQWMQEFHPLLLEISNELEKFDCKCIETPEFPSLFWIIRNRRNIDVVHVHWPEQYYEYAWHLNNTFIIKITESFLFLRLVRQLLGLLWLFGFVRLLQLLKVPLIWTLHDLFPHADQTPSKLQIFSRKYLMEHTKVLLLNCSGVESLVKENFGIPKHTVVAPLGDYKLFYPDTIQRDEARKYFDLNEMETMCLFFGTQRTHRNAQDLIRCFKEIKDPTISLRIIGYAPEPIRSAVEEMAWGDWRIHLYLSRASNLQIEYALKASDFLIMPGKKYLTSAVISLALSYGIPVIAPRYGCAEDMVKDAGVLYDDMRTDGLKRALEYALKNKGSLRKVASKQMSKWSWQLTTQQIYKAYQLALNDKSG